MGDNLVEAGLPDWEKLVAAIHAAPPQAVIHFAGAGSQALAWLHGLGGSSRTVLEATDCYSAASLREVVGFEPPHFTTEAVARALANRAFLRACHLTEPGTPVAGVGCTATIATDRAKRGEHRAHVAVSNAAGWLFTTSPWSKARAPAGRKRSWSACCCCGPSPRPLGWPIYPR